MINDNLKLIYVLKVGKNIKDENIYEFIFSSDITNIKSEDWGWHEVPAITNANPPSMDCVDEVYTIKTDIIELFCLHEATDREYMHGYHTIHALAYEIEKNDYDDYDISDDDSLLVFHYGMSFNTINELLSERGIKLKNS